jgi:hypothetical protein
VALTPWSASIASLVLAISSGGSKAVQNHVCARRGERAGDAKTDPAGGTGHQRDLADEMSCLAGDLRLELDIHVPNLLAPATSGL